MKNHCFLTLCLGLLLICGKLQATITPTESQVWWGYFSDTDGDYLNSHGGGMGYGSAATYDLGIYIPESHPFVGGSSIKALRLWVGYVSKFTSDITVWISKTLPTDITTADYSQSVPIASVQDGQATEIELTTPFVVNNEAIYVGFTFSTSSGYPIKYRGNAMENTLLYRINSGKWQDYSSYYGKLALQLLLDGGTYPTNSVTVDDYGHTTVLQGDDVSVPLTLTNSGKNPVTQISYTITSDDGSTSEEKTEDVGTLALGDNKTIYLNFGNEPRKYKRNVTVTKVNGVANTAEKKTATGSLIITSEKPAVMPVVEEFTATWCGYCPYGIVGMQKAHEMYGDQVALIAAHSSDVMDKGYYTDVINAYVSGFPSSRINRDDTSYYPTSSLTSYISRYTDILTVGSIQLTAQWTDDAKTAVNFVTKSKFYYDDNDAQYGIAFVLVEDGLTGTGYNWSQSNFLSGQSGNEDMTFWYNSPSNVPGIVYDHVAVAAWDIKNGINGSVSPTIHAGVEQKFSDTRDISTNSLIQDKSKLTAYALLIDRETGKIANAARATITDASTVTTGDANGDGVVDIADAVCIVNHVVGKETSTFIEAAADMNGDGVVDIADAVKIVNIVVGKE